MTTVAAKPPQWLNEEDFRGVGKLSADGEITLQHVVRVVAEALGKLSANGTVWHVTGFPIKDLPTKLAAGYRVLTRSMMKDVYTVMNEYLSLRHGFREGPDGEVLWNDNALVYMPREKRRGLVQGEADRLNSRYEVSVRQKMHSMRPDAKPFVETLEQHDGKGLPTP